MAKGINGEIDGRRDLGGSRPVTREDDKRLDGRPAHIPTPESRQKVEELARVITQGQIAILMDISISTLQKHYPRELELGLAKAASAIGVKMIEKALTGHFASMAFFLSRRGGWNDKLDIVAPKGALIRQYNLGDKSPEELEALLPVLDAIIASGGDDKLDDGLDS